MKIAARLDSISPSATMAMKIKAEELAKQGKDVLSFAVGEPDFPTPEYICEAARQAIAEGFTKYTAASGITELKEAVVAAIERDLGVSYEPGEVLISNGAKHSLMNVFQTLVEPGDEVIVFAPYWVTYPDQIRFCGGKVKVIMTRGEDDFQPDLEEVRAAVTDRTVALLVNTPCNPSGAVYSREVIEGLAALAIERDLVIISDEIYKHIIFDGAEHVSPATLGDEAKEQTLIIDGVAKSYSMTGWRIGWLVGDRDFVAAAGRLQSQGTSCPNTIAQRAAVEALNGPQDSVEQMRRQFEARRDLVMDRIADIPGVRCSRPRGAFYVFPDVTEHYGRTLGGAKVEDSTAMAEYLLTEGLISTVPGAAFGADDYVRLSFACSTEEIEEGLARLKRTLA